VAFWNGLDLGGGLGTGFQRSGVTRRATRLHDTTTRGSLEDPRRSDGRPQVESATDGQALPLEEIKTRYLAQAKEQQLRERVAQVAVVGATAGTCYVVYRVVRMLPSLLIPGAQVTIPVNAAVP
jgi:hypothetical protein